jgi:hypothetical protein
VDANVDEFGQAETPAWAWYTGRVHADCVAVSVDAHPGRWFMPK